MLTFVSQTLVSKIYKILENSKFNSNQSRVINRTELQEILQEKNKLVRENNK